ncbi:signal peptidase I [Clostridium sp. LP20]|uniref:signal peptidase I n=1 Tax=Clostridium sp. LP20 TaxID=3418665 RepID=UPI003EE44648
MSKGTQKKKGIVKIIGNLLFYLILIFLLALSFSVLKAKKEGKQPEFFGYKFFVILTGSMSPTIEPGDLIVVKDLPKDEIKVDDIITFGKTTDSITTHRVKEVRAEDRIKFITQGDANNIQDPAPVFEENVQGSVVKIIPRVGGTVKYIQENILMIMIIILILILAGIAIKEIIKNK